MLTTDHADGAAPEIGVLLYVQHQGETIGGPRHGGLAEVLILSVHGVAITWCTYQKLEIQNTKYLFRESSYKQDQIMFLSMPACLLVLDWTIYNATETLLEPL